MSIAQATASRRSATERNARARLWPRARRAAYLALLTGSCWNGNSSPVVDCITEAWMRGAAADDDLVLPDRRVTGTTPHRHRRAL